MDGQGSRNSLITSPNPTKVITTDGSAFDDVIHLDTELGFWCINEENSDTCKDYQVSYCCPETQEGTCDAYGHAWTQYYDKAGTPGHGLGPSDATSKGCVRESLTRTILLTMVTLKPLKSSLQTKCAMFQRVFALGRMMEPLVMPLLESPLKKDSFASTMLSINAPIGKFRFAVPNGVLVMSLVTQKVGTSQLPIRAVNKIVF